MSAKLCCVLGIGIAFLAGAPLCAAQGDISKAFLGIGEVTRNDVYIRSGASQNHYTISKLRAGDRVTIVGEQSEWLEIQPPVGSFSLVSADFVDTTDDQTGVVNADNVRVRAGSLLSEQKSTVQCMLSRGSVVQILGRNPDGFLRIAAPPGASLWISKQYVERIPEALLQLEASGAASAVDAAAVNSDPAITTAPGDHNLAQSAAGSPSAITEGGNSPASIDSLTRSGAATDHDIPLQTGGSKTVKRVVDAAAARNAGESQGMGSQLPVAKSPLSDVPPTPQRMTLLDIDAALQFESGKPAADRDIAPIIQRYKSVAEQTEDEFAQRYAQARLEQIGGIADIIDSLRQLRELNATAETKRAKFIEERANRDFQSLPPVLTGYDAQGELRLSQVYSGDGQPKRYRLVDPSIGDGRTIAYVELPPDADIKLDGLVGRFVGIRASEKRLQIGGVDPIPVYLVQEVTPLPAPQSLNSAAGQS